MNINNYDKWKNIPIDILCRKRFSKIEEERIYYEEWRSFHLNIINMLANYLNRKDKKWDEELDEKTITSEELVAHIKKRFEAMGINFDGRVKIVIEETEKLRKR
jgi:hypothetical protein